MLYMLLLMMVPVLLRLDWGCCVERIRRSLGSRCVGVEAVRGVGAASGVYGEAAGAALNVGAHAGRGSIRYLQRQSFCALMRLHLVIVRGHRGGVGCGGGGLVCMVATPGLLCSVT